MTLINSRFNKFIVFVALGVLCFLFTVYQIKQQTHDEVAELQLQIAQLKAASQIALKNGVGGAPSDAVELQLRNLQRQVARLKAASGLPDERLSWSGFNRRQSIQDMTKFPKYPFDIHDEDEMCAHDKECLNKTGRHRIASTNNIKVREGQRSVRANGKTLSYNDVAMSYERMFDHRGMHSTTTFMNVAMQQDPSDAFAIGDLLWRVRPRLLIELGTSGGGSALFFARLMLGYDPEARIITIDPFSGPVGLDGAVLENWNRQQIALFCPQCKSAADQSVWKHAVTFIRSNPTNASTVAYVRDRVLQIAKQGFPIMVIEDSNHVLVNVRGNLNFYSPFVSPGSYFICQDTRNGKMHGPTDALNEFLTNQSYTASQNHSLFVTQNNNANDRVWMASNDSNDGLWLDEVPVYVRDRRPEYYIITQHAGGYLRRLEHGENTLTPFYDEILLKESST